MDRTTRYLKTALAILVTLACLYLLGQLRGFLTDVWTVIYAVLLPFLISLVISYLLQPVVDLLVRRHVPRSVAILVIYLVFIVLIAIAVLQAIPAVSRQLMQLMERFPILLHQVDTWLNHLNDQKRYLPDAAKQGIENALTKVESSLAGSVSNLFMMLSSTVNALFIVFVIPFLVFYMLKDADAIGRGMLRMTPVRWRKYTKVVLVSVDKTIGSYVRGQLLVMLCVGVLTYVGFLIIHLPYALVFALFLASVDVIPFFGPVIGALPALILAFSIGPQMALKVLIVNIAVQQLEGNLISPQIMGKSLHLHPMSIVAALLLGGELGGIVGLIVSVPLLSLGRVLYENIKELRKAG